MTEQSGTFHIQDRTLKMVLPLLCASILAPWVVIPLLLPFLMKFLDLYGQAAGVMAAVLGYVLFRVTFRTASRLFPGGGTRTVAWEVTADALILDGQAAARDTIVNVHIWPNRDALGHTLPGWVVNIERSGRNIPLCVPDRDGVDGDSLRNLVRALGYGDRWPDV